MHVEQSIEWFETPLRQYDVTLMVEAFSDIGRFKNSWWRHHMETFSASLALCVGNSPVPVNSPHKGQWRGALMFSLICVWINGWVNNREAGDLWRHRCHYDVNVMSSVVLFCPYLPPHRWTAINVSVQWNLSVTTTSMIRFITCE